MRRKTTDDVDPRYMSQNMRESLKAAQDELKENPVTRWESIRLWFRVTFYYPYVIRRTKFLIWWNKH